MQCWLLLVACLEANQTVCEAKVIAQNALTLGLPESSETFGTKLVVKLLPLFPTTILVG